jgi:ribosomal protein S18 acetylase RimI-like enzyme
MLSRIEEKALAAGFNQVSLMVAIENQRARQFYDRQGFRTTAIHLESNKRVPYLGAGYQRMVKELGE